MGHKFDFDNNFPCNRGTGLAFQSFYDFFISSIICFICCCNSSLDPPWLLFLFCFQICLSFCLLSSDILWYLFLGTLFFYFSFSIIPWIDHEPYFVPFFFFHNFPLFSRHFCSFFYDFVYYFPLKTSTA